MSGRSTRRAASAVAVPSNTSLAMASAASVAIKLGASLGSAALQALNQYSQNLATPRTVVAAATVPRKASVKQMSLRTDLGLSQGAAMKLATLTELASTPFVVEPEAIKSPLAAFVAAQTPIEIERTSLALNAAIMQSNDQLLVSSISIAARDAALEIGFPTVRLIQTSTASIRVIAEQPSGRALVTEISTVPDAAPKIASEVTGMSDKSCLPILEAFDAAMAKRGVQLSDLERKYTGGIPDLEVTREFLRNKVRHLQPAQSNEQASATTGSQAAPRRASQRTRQGN